MEETAASAAGVYSDTNGVPKAEGRVTHVDVGPGDVANRILSVGTASRAAVVAACLDDLSFSHRSSRGFTTHTGRFEGVPVSVVATGMGTAMMDFMVREIRHVTAGPMAIVRFGTCGGLREGVDVGTIAVASEGAVMCQRSYDAFLDLEGPESAEAYRVSRVCPADEPLSRLLREELVEAYPMVCDGLNVTADSFYASQGRRDETCFDDRNATLVDDLLVRHPRACACEMETFQLLHLARCSRPGGASIRAAAAAIIVANRHTKDVASADTIADAERRGGRAALRALVRLPL